MFTIVLPSHARTAWRRGFWTAIFASVGLLLACAFLFTLAPVVILFPATVALFLISVAGLISRHVGVVGYRAWNKLARYYAKAAEVILLGICYYVVLSVLGGAGVSDSSWVKHSRRSSASSWVSRQELPNDSYRSPHHAKEGRRLHLGWVRNYASWAVSSRHASALAILPFLLMISTLEADIETDSPSDIYTLF